MKPTNILPILALTVVLAGATLAGAQQFNFTTLAGHGQWDEMGSVARFNEPAGLAAVSAGTPYVTDTGNPTIRKVTPTGVVTTLAGLAGGQGSANGTGSAARFWNPHGVAVDSTGNVYVADYSAIRKIT